VPATSGEKPQVGRELLCSLELPKFSHLSLRNRPQSIKEKKVLLKVLLIELVKLVLDLILLELPELQLLFLCITCPTAKPLAALGSERAEISNGH